MPLGPGVADPPATWALAHHQETRHRIGERLVIHVRSVLGGMDHEYSLASASA